MKANLKKKEKNKNNMQNIIQMFCHVLGIVCVHVTHGMELETVMYCIHVCIEMVHVGCRLVNEGSIVQESEGNCDFLCLAILIKY